MSMLDWVLTIGLSVALVVYLKLVVKLNFECPECGLSYTNLPKGYIKNLKS